MANRFCSGCGAKLVTGANFCVECGERQAGARGPRYRGRYVTERYAPVVVIATVLLAGTAAVLYGRLTEKPAPNVPTRDSAPASAAGGGDLPSDHPPLKLTDEDKNNLRDLQRKAEAAPDDAAAWKSLAEAQLRAGQLESEYLPQAASSYRHLMEKDANDLDALRGLGNVAYYQQQPAVAAGYYEKYVDKKPDDLEGRTDLGTMYLSGGNPQKALDTYQRVLQVDPNFFSAQFSSAIAYRALGDSEKSLAALEKARTLAPDDRTRSLVDQLLARMKGEPAAPAAGGAPHAGMAANAAAPPAPAADNFQAAAEALFRQNPVMGPKVQRVEWQGEHAAKVYLRDFPMDQMGAEMKNMFADRMKGRIKELKTKFQVSEAANFDLIDQNSGRVMATVSD